MKRGVNTAGLALLSCLLLSAFTAQSAVAQKGTVATNTTAFTCVENGGQKDFSDSHCDKFVGAENGKFGHVAIQAGETTQIELSNEKTSPDTSTAFPAVITISGFNYEVSCATVKTAGNSWIENVEKEGKHTVKGTVRLDYRSCTVLKPGTCKVREPLVANLEFNGVEGLKFIEETKAMGVEFTEDQSYFLEILFEGGSCGSKGILLPLAGSVIATGAPNPSQANKHSGTTWISESGNEMQTLKTGFFKDTVSWRLTPRMAGGGNPISLTTVT